MKTFLAFIGLLAIIAVIAAAVFFFGGFYSVAGTEEDPGIVNWTLAQIRQASVARHGKDTPPVSPRTNVSGLRSPARSMFQSKTSGRKYIAPRLLWIVAWR